MCKGYPKGYRRGTGHSIGEYSVLTYGFLSLEDYNRRTVVLRELFRDVTQARGGARRVGVGPRRHVVLDAHCCRSM